MLLIALLLIQAAAEPAAEELTVTGTRKKVEAPVGSRIPRPREEFGNRQIASTNVAGLTPQSGMDPFAGPAKRISVKQCKGDKPLAKATLCALVEADAAIGKGEYARARAVLFRIDEAAVSTPADRLAATQFAYRIAELEDDATARENALDRMVASGAMPEPDRLAAQRSLVALALKRRDEATAIIRLERLLADIPGDARSLANLAALHAGRGDHARARPLMLAAVNVIQSQGETPPLSWTDYLQTQPR